jgi:hypothetical protein
MVVILSHAFCFRNTSLGEELTRTFSQERLYFFREMFIVRRMNKAILFVLLLTAGCGPSAPAPSVANSPITGAFGYTFGQKLGDATETSPDEDGAGLSAVLFTTNFPPFDVINISVLLDRRIYCIGAVYRGDNWQTAKQPVLSALSAKYGPGLTTNLDGWNMVVWRDRQGEIGLGEKTGVAEKVIKYTDYDLTQAHERAISTARSKKAEQIAPSL